MGRGRHEKSASDDLMGSTYQLRGDNNFLISSAVIGSLSLVGFVVIFVLHFREKYHFRIQIEPEEGPHSNQESSQCFGDASRQEELKKPHTKANDVVEEESLPPHSGPSVERRVSDGMPQMEMPETSHTKLEPDSTIESVSSLDFKP